MKGGILVKNATLRGELAAGYHAGQPEFHAAVADVDPDTVEDWRPYLQAAMDSSRLVELDPARDWVLKDLGTYNGVMVRMNRIIEGHGATLKLADDAILPAKSVSLLATFKTGSPDASVVDHVTIRNLNFDLNGVNQADQSVTLMALNATGHHWIVERPGITGARAGQRECFAARVVPPNGNDNVNTIRDGLFTAPAPNAEYQSTVTGHIWEISAFSAGTVEGCRIYGDRNEQQMSTIHGVTPGCRIRPRIRDNHAEGAGMNKCVWWQWGTKLSESWFMDIDAGNNTHLNTA